MAKIREQNSNEEKIEREEGKGGPGIRTMREDIAMLSGKKKIPKEKRRLSIFAGRISIERRKEERKRERKLKELKKKEEERRKKEEELRKKMEEEKKKEAILRQKEMERKRKEEERRKREMEAIRLREEIARKKEAERLKREGVKRGVLEEKIKREEEARKRKEEERQRALRAREEERLLLMRRRMKEEEERRRREIKRKRKEIKRKIKKKLKVPSKVELLLSEEPFKPKKASPLPGILIFIFLLGAISGTLFFLLNYQLGPALPTFPPLPKVQVASLPQPPSSPTHKECRGIKCIVVKGEGVDLCKTDEDCKPALPPIVIGISEEIGLSNIGSDVFIPLLDKKFQKDYPPGTFIEIVPKYKGELLTISELFKALDLHPPKDVKDNLETYTLYLYSQKELFVQKRRNRLCIAFRIKKGKAGIVRVAMAKWEKVLPDDFHKVHTLWKRGARASPTFLDNYYSGIHIRYTNFPVPDLSIDWAIKGDILIITTSRESMWRTIDVLK